MCDRRPDDVVYWSSTGRVLHRDPDCPPHVRARRRALAALESGDYLAMLAAPQIHWYDFAEDAMTSGIYPPESFDLCRRCG